jgi:hypothetical protein
VGTQSAVRTYRTGLLMIATAGLLAAAPPAHADTQYGGNATRSNAPNGPSITLIRHDDGRVTGRMAVHYTCRDRSMLNRIVRLSGTTPDGVSFTATGKTTLGGKGVIRFTMTGAIAPDAVTGKLVSTLKSCPKATRDIVLRTESAPAGAPAVPGASTLFAGLTGQTTGGFRLPVALRVTNKGGVRGSWQATMKCGPKAIAPMFNFSPTAAIKADGSFSRSEAYTVRYNDGSSERFRVSFKGRFLADGAVGTLRARSQLRKKGKRYYPCDSGTQTWAARP